MQKSLLIGLLSSFTPEEMKEFSEYISSYFFNKNKSVIKLFDYIKKFHPGYDSEKLEKEYIYNKLFHVGEYDDGYMRLIIFKLQKLAEDYLAYCNYKRDDRRVLHHLIDQLFMKNDNKLVDKKIKEAGKYLAETRYEIPDDFYYKFNFEFYKNCRRSEKFVQHKKEIPDDSIYKEPEYLICFFILRILANHLYHLNQSTQINYNPKLLFLEEIIHYLENNPRYLDYYFIKAIYLKVLLLKERNDEYFYKLKEFLFREAKNTGSEDNFNTISILINYIHEKYMETSSKKYMEEQFEILKFALDNGLHSFRKGGYFDNGRFRNYVVTALELGKTEWAKSFIEKYKNKLDPEFKDNYVNLCSSFVTFSDGNYEESINHLGGITGIKDVTMKLSVKTLYLKIYYETASMEQAISLCDSFRHFIASTNEIPEAAKEPYKNFLIRYNNIVSLQNRFDEFKCSKLISEISSPGRLINRDWLIEKVNELKSS